MRESLHKLINNTLLLHYRLPVNVNGKVIPRSHISTYSDHCLKQIGSDDDIARIIYNGVVEYAYNDNEIILSDLDNLQIRALQSKLKYNPIAPHKNKLAYGFQGEVLLHLIIEHFYHAYKAIARGYMYSPLENQETKGYDSYLMVERDGYIYLWFGEAKFYINGYKSSLDALFVNIDKALSDEYLNRNFVALDNHYEKIDPLSRIPNIIDVWRKNPLINMAVEAKHYNMHLVYPMLIIFDDKADTYEELIFEVINHLKTYGPVSLGLTIPHDLFFIFLPVNNSRIIKTKVLQWISQKLPLMP